MYPVTVAGRILTCMCAFFGVATSGMLVSVLVERYQRIYNQKQFPTEQVISAIDTSDSEHDEKQDFIEKNLSGTQKNLSSEPILLPTTAPPVASPSNDRKHSQSSSSSANVRFIITITEDQTNDSCMRGIADELMTQLTETIQSTDEKINLTLISADVDCSNDENVTTNQLPSIAEE